MCILAHHCILIGIIEISIKEEDQVSPRVVIYSHSSHIAIRLYGCHYTETDEREMKGLNIAPVHIGKFVYIGAPTIFLVSTLGGHIAAGLVVKDDVQAFQSVVGSPA